MYIRKFSHMKESFLVLVNSYNELQIFSLAFFFSFVLTYSETENHPQLSAVQKLGFTLDCQQAIMDSGREGTKVSAPSPLN